ncbi:MAG TPA: M55 family metallopeptidase [Candidatus Baltobacteraceae bacterium]|nr:M55 family metallopeptidase [Candidatus Baltobacteraceae bacterium]
MKRPRIYISADMEGTAGVSLWRQCDHTNATEYPMYRRYMSREVAAAANGAKQGGAAEVLVNDAHGSMANLLWDELPPDVRMISGSRKPNSMMQGINEGFEGAIFTGYHAKAGHPDGVLAHTYVGSAIFDVRINGRPCSEALINAAVAGCHGVPLIMISGDRAIVDEITSALPWVVGVPVKAGIGNMCANSLSPAAAQQVLQEAAQRAVQDAARAKVFAFEAPFELRITTTQIEYAEFVAGVPGVERIDGRTVSYCSDDYLNVYRMFVTAYRLVVAAGAAA